LHPDVKIPRQFKLKEHYVMDALKEHYKDTLTMTFDKCIQRMHSQSHQNDVGNKCIQSIEGEGCCKHRPDLFIDFGTHCLIVEIDENQHANYICEQKRMIALYEAIGFRKVVFIRFNPDGYSEGTQKYKSPFGYTPTGMVSINKEEMVRRITRLIEQIDIVKEEPQEPLTIHYLFFNY
jgi:hypothetical protein